MSHFCGYIREEYNKPLRFIKPYGILFDGATDKRQAVSSPDLYQGRFLPPDLYRKGGCQMVTYSDLIQTGILIVGIIALFMQANKKK